MTLGTYIAEGRSSLHLTQAEFAGRLNVSKSAVAKWETDRGTPDIEHLYQISQIFGVSADEIYGVIFGTAMKLRNNDIIPELIGILNRHGYEVIKKDT